MKSDPSVFWRLRDGFCVKRNKKAVINNISFQKALLLPKIADK